VHSEGQPDKGSPTLADLVLFRVKFKIINPVFFHKIIGKCPGGTAVYKSFKKHPEVTPTPAFFDVGWNFMNGPASPRILKHGSTILASLSRTTKRTWFFFINRYVPKVISPFRCEWMRSIKKWLMDTIYIPSLPSMDSHSQRWIKMLGDYSCRSCQIRLINRAAFSFHL